MVSSNAELLNLIYDSIVHYHYQFSIFYRDYLMISYLSLFINNSTVYYQKSTPSIQSFLSFCFKSIHFLIQLLLKKVCFLIDCLCL